MFTFSLPFNFEIMLSVSMAFSNRLYCIARSLKSVGGVFATRLPAIRDSQNIIHGPICGQRNLFISTKLSEAIKVGPHGSLRSTLLVLDESDKEVGVMKWNQLKALALEGDLKIHCVNENAIPHPIYKLISAKAHIQLLRQEKKAVKAEKVKTKNLVLNANISQRDLSIKIESILDWLTKKNVVVVKVENLTYDKKHLEILKEITKAVSSVAVMSESKSTSNVVTFTLVSLENVTTSPNVPKPLTIEELKEAKANQTQKVSQQPVDPKQPEEAEKTERNSIVTSDHVEKETDKTSKTKKATTAKVEEINTKSKSKKSKGEPQQAEGKAQS